MYHDISMTIRWSAKTQEWRVGTDCGQYWGAKCLDDVPEAIRGLLKGDAEATLRMIELDILPKGR